MDFFYYFIKFTVIALQIVKEFNPSQESDAQVGTYLFREAVKLHICNYYLQSIC